MCDDTNLPFTDSSARCFLSDRRLRSLCCISPLLQQTRLSFLCDFSFISPLIFYPTRRSFILPQLYHPHLTSDERLFQVRFRRRAGQDSGTALLYPRQACLTLRKCQWRCHDRRHRRSQQRGFPWQHLSLPQPHNHNLPCTEEL